MRRLRTDIDGSKVLVESLAGEAERVYTLTNEGFVFLTQLLRVGENDEVRPSDLRLMIDRGWVTLRLAAQHTQAPPQPVAKSMDERPEPESADPNTTTRDTRPLLARRTRGREVALQALYLLEQNPGVDEKHIDQFLQRRLRDPKLIAFTNGIVHGVREHLKHLDTLISDVAENWRIDRMAAIDRNILRVGAYEMLYCKDVPTKVAINEALELAKRYSTAQSSRFVNGILDRLQTAQPETAPEPEGVDSTLPTDNDSDADVAPLAPEEAS